MALEAYRAKRDFRKTPEPVARLARSRRRPIFVVQEHHASRLHYDFRLEADGVLKSWAIPKQPSLDPSQKRLAVRVEDHPLGYARFAGTIPNGEYGAGTVSIWDHGTYDDLLADKPVPQNLTQGIEEGRCEFALHGTKLKGRFALVRMRRGRHGKESWLLIKLKDEFAQPGHVDSDEPSKAKRAAVRRPSPREKGRAVRSASMQEVTLTHGDRVLYPGVNITKRDVFVFYRRIARRLLPYLRDRPATLERLPEGLGGPDKPHFWQKNTPAYYPDWIRRVELTSERGKPVSYVLVNDLPTLLYLVNQGTLTIHVWASRVQDLDRPDFVLFDLDPGEADMGDAVAVAKRLHAILAEEGYQSFAKTSGKTGLHIVTPWVQDGGYDEARAWAADIAGRVAEAMPDQATTEIRKAKRERRVYVDVLQNAKGHHAVPPYVLRAIPGAPVSTPLNWREVQLGLDPARFNLKTLFGRLARQKQDPMAGLLRARPRA